MCVGGWGRGGLRNKLSQKQARVRKARMNQTLGKNTEPDF